MSFLEALVRGWRRVNDVLKTDTALRRQLRELRLDPVGNVHVDSIFYESSLQFHRFSHLRLSKRPSSWREYQWETLERHLNDLVNCHEVEGVEELPLLRLGGVRSSKSTGVWDSLAQFGRSRVCSSISRQNEADFQKNIAHSFPEDLEPFTVYDVWWNDRLYWDNAADNPEGGSHHAAAACAQAAAQNKTFTIPCRVTRVNLDEKAAKYILRNTNSLVVAEKTALQLWQVFEAFDVPFQYCTYNPRGEDLKLVFLPRCSRKAKMAADTLLHASGSPKSGEQPGTAFDFATFLEDSLASGDSQG